MGKQNQNHPQNVNGNNDGEQPQTGENKPKKKPLKERIVCAYHSFRAKPIGKWTVRVAKGAGLLGVGIGGFEIGRKSVKPTVVYIEHNEEETEEAPATETPAEEPVEEEKTEE